MASGDERPDAIVTANWSSKNVTVLQNYLGGFNPATSLSLSGRGRSVLVAELTGDSLPDVAVATQSPDEVVVSRHLGGFSFTSLGSISLDEASDPVALSASDLDGDDDVDVVVAASGSNEAVFLENDGGGLFSTVCIGASPAPSGLSLGEGPADITVVENLGDGTETALRTNGDAITDLAGVNALSATVSSRHGRSDVQPWLFTKAPDVALSGNVKRGDVPLSAPWPKAIVATRLNPDAAVDLAVSLAGSPTRIAVLGNQGSGSFENFPAQFVRDIALDNIYVAHEFGHGVTFALAGGPQTIGLLTGEQTGPQAEGYSDLLSLILTQTSGPEEPRGWAVFRAGEPPSGVGRRAIEYSADPCVDPVTFAYYNTFGGPHSGAPMWATVLWDVYWTLTELHGRSNDLYLGAFAAGAGAENVLLQLIVDGLKLGPVEPTFLQARDSILLADALDFGSANTPLLWEAFARRGLGWDACDNWDAGASTCLPPDVDAETVREGFLLPPLGDVYGTVFEDEDCDGTWDFVEPPLSGWTVFLDTDRNGLLDPGEPSDVTDGDGIYRFQNLLYPPPAEYSVAIVLESGWRQTAPSTPLDPSSVLNWNGSSFWPSQEYADVWGEGNFAYLAHQDATGVEIINLAALEEDPGDANGAVASRWSEPGGYVIADVKVEDGIGYFANDEDSVAVKVAVFIVDVSDPNHPVELSRLTPALGAPETAHNVSLHDGFLYVADDHTPVVTVWDVSSPAPPVLALGIDVTPHGGGGRIHDITALDGRLYVCEKASPGWIHIYDIAGVPAPPVHLGSFVSGSETHSCWPTADHTHLVVARETQPASPINRIEIWDIGDPGNVFCATRLRMDSQGSGPSCGSTVAVPGSALSPHNPVVDGNLLYVSWYEAGVLLFDVSDPADPVELGRYDTYAGPINPVTGCWGVYPFLGPDRILASDTETGLYVLSNQSTHTVVLPSAGGSVFARDFGVSSSCD